MSAESKPPSLNDPDEEPIPLSGSEDEPEALPLEGEDAPAGQQVSSKIRTFGGLGGAKTQKQYKRAPNLTGAGAIRCRLFHSKISVAAMDHMVEAINEWLQG